MKLLSFLRFFKLFITFLFILSKLVSLSQDSFSQLEVIGTEEGLTQNTVYDIFQDSDGFIWFGTFDGLNRYDGDIIKQFKSNPYDKTSLNNNYVSSIIEDNNNRLYVGTRDGVSVYDKEKDEFSFIGHLKDDSTQLTDEIIYSLLLGSDNNVWIGGLYGLRIYNPDNETLVDLSGSEFAKEGILNMKIWNLYEDERRNIWISTFQNGLYKYSLEENTLKKVYDGLVHSLIEDKIKMKWMVCNEGVLIINPDGEIIERFYVENYKHASVSKDAKIIQTSTNEILICYRYKGLYRFDWSYRRFESVHLSNNIELEKQLTYLSLVEDHHGNLWLGTYNEGVRRVSLYSRGFQNYTNDEKGTLSIIDENVYSFVEDEEGSVWIGTLSGISVLDRENNTVSNIQKTGTGNSISDNRIWAMCKDSKSNIWIGTSHGLNQYDVKTKKFKHYFKEDDDGLVYNEIYALVGDSEGKIWVGTNQGLSVFNPENGKFKNYFHTDDENSLVNNGVWHLSKDNEGRIWVGTMGGLSCYDKSSDSFINYKNNPNNDSSISSNNIQCITSDSDGYLWLGTSFGINRFDPVKKTFKHFTIEDGLPNNTVYGILEAGDYLWFSTNNGLVKFNRKTFEVFSFDYTDGIQGNEFNFPALKTEDGELFFGGVNGVTSFYPNDIKISQDEQAIIFTDLNVNYKKIVPGQELYKHVVIEKSINYDSIITLSHKVSNFSINFTTTEFRSPHKIQYRYKVDELDDWIDIGKQTQIFFTGLPPGNYTLRIVNTNSDGVWSENERVLKINILPPWWRNIYFYIFLGVLAVIVIILIVRFKVYSLKRDKDRLESMVGERTVEIKNQKEEILVQKERIEEQNAMLEEKNVLLERHKTDLEEKVSVRTQELQKAKDQAEESNRLKTSFLANMSHEIRTPLNAIMGFSELIVKQDNEPEELTSFNQIIQSNCDTLLHLIDDIIDLSKIQANQMSLKLTGFNLVSLMQELFVMYSEEIGRSTQCNANLFYVNSEEEFWIVSDYVRLKQILSNLISNAIKYTAEGEIRFGFKKNDGELEFFVHDTGLGIDEENIPLVFRQFYKVEHDKTKLFRGVGLGLSISNLLVELFGGKIWVESKLGEGSNFMFTLPLQSEITSHDKEKDDIRNITGIEKDWNGKKILIAEDNKNNYLYLKSILGKTNAYISWAKDGKEAIHMALEEHFEIVLMDIKMPFVDGIEATRTIKEEKPDLPIIAVTAFAYNTDKELALKAGCVEYLTKPVRKDELLNLIGVYI